MSLWLTWGFHHQPPEPNSLREAWGRHVREKRKERNTQEHEQKVRDLKEIARRKVEEDEAVERLEKEAKLEAAMEGC